MNSTATTFQLSSPGNSTKGIMELSKDLTSSKLSKNTERNRFRSGDDLSTSHHQNSMKTIKDTPNLTESTEMLILHYCHEHRYIIYFTQSLKTTIDRVLPFWNETIVPTIKSGKNVLVVAHGNSLRAIVKYLNNISNEGIFWK